MTAEDDLAGAGVTLDVADGVGTLTLDLPPTGLLGGRTVAALSAHLDTVEDDDGVRVLVLRSAVPGWFACHFDLREVLAFDKRDEPDDQLKPYHAMCERLRTMPVPTIAVVEGRAGGGGAEIALSCDMRFADESAVFCQPEVGMGIIPGGTGTVRLAGLVGRSRALEIVLGCDDVDARTAEAWGLVNRTLPTAALWPFVDRLSRRLATFPPYAVAAAKDAVLGDAGRRQAVTDHLLHEARRFREVLADPRATEHMRRFVERGGQDPANEDRLGDFLGELHDPATDDDAGPRPGGDPP